MPSWERRGFLQLGGGAAIAGLLGVGKAGATDARARVVLVRRRDGNFDLVEA